MHVVFHNFHHLAELLKKSLKATESPDLAHYPFSPPPGWGFTLPLVYIWWASVVLAMYPLCVWFGRLKQRRSDAWLRYS